MNIKITVTGNAGDQVERLRKKLPTWVRHGLGDYAHDFSYYIRQSWLHGKALQYVTGTTAYSVKAFYDRKTRSWYIRPGVGIRGSLNYLARWIGTPHEFMKPGFTAYSSAHKITDVVIDSIDKNL